MDENREHEINTNKEKYIRKIFKIKWIMLFTFFFILCAVLDGTHVWYHEHVHAAIFDSYGVNYDYGWAFKGMVLSFYVKSDDTSNCDNVCMGLQMENEILAYNLTYIFYSLWLIFFLYLLKCFYDDFKYTFIILQYGK